MSIDDCDPTLAAAFDALALRSGLRSLAKFSRNAFLPLILPYVAYIESPVSNLLYGALFVVSLVQVVTGDPSDGLGSVRAFAVLAAMIAAGGGNPVVAGVIAHRSAPDRGRTVAEDKNLLPAPSCY